MRTTEDFSKARLGSSAIEACGTCNTPTGTLLFKKRGNPKGPEYIGPRYLANPEAQCEFCTFLAMWMNHENVDPKETGLKYGAAKIVTRDPKTGVDTLVAFVPFSEKDLEENKGSLADGSEFEWAHGMVVFAEKDESTNDMKLVKIDDR